MLDAMNLLCSASVRTLTIPICLSVAINDVARCPGDGHISSRNNDRVEVIISSRAESLAS